MISIVYSTIKSNREVYDHLRKTCGVPDVEVIEIVNPGIMSLTEAYQKGLEEAYFDIVVFVHNDLHFTDNNWGRKLIKLFETTDFGVIGLAGTTNLGLDGKWWEQRTKMVGIVKHTDGKKTWENRYSGAFPNQVIQTVNCDGLFIAIDKNKIKYEFDTTIPGFHLYDLDFTFGNHVSGVKVGITTDIRVIHKGLGETNQEWDDNRKVFIEKFKDHLPANIVPELVVDNVETNIKETPKVAIIIHGKNAKQIDECITNLVLKTKYSNYRILVGYSDYDDVQVINPNISEVIPTTIDNYSANTNKIITEHVKADEEIVVIMSENSMLQNDVISLGVKTIIKNKNCGTITSRIYNADNTIHNNGYEVWNIVKAPLKEGDEPQSSLLVNLVGNDSYYAFRNEPIFDTVGGTKEFMMCRTELARKIKFNEAYKKAFQDLEFNFSAINDKKINIVLGNGVIQLKETIISDSEYYEDLNKVFLPYVYSQGLSTIDKYIKNYIVPTKNEQQ